MPIKQSVGERLASWATVYFIVGGLLVIWSTLWIVFMMNHEPRGDSAFYFAGGFLLTGLVLISGALLSGPLGRSARRADMSPDTPATPAPTPENPNPTQLTTTPEHANVAYTSTSTEPR